MIYIFDIDGTLSDLTHRLSYLQQTPPEAGSDKPIFEVITVARALAKAGHLLIFCTGRSEDIRGITQDWLNKYRVPTGPLLMRHSGDYRDDNVVKSELLDMIMQQYGESLASYGGVFEDRQQVVNMYRARGLRVFQVAKGDF
jgi:hypothetical protein